MCVYACVWQVRTVRTDEARGLLWLMEEEALQPGGSEETLLGRLFSYYGPAEGESKGKGRTSTQMHILVLITCGDIALTLTSTQGFTRTLMIYVMGSNILVQTMLSYLKNSSLYFK